MFTSRPYRPDDLVRLWHFVSAHGKMHPGDLVWRVLMHTTYRPERDLRIWQREGEIVGFCLQKGPFFDYELSRALSAHDRSGLLEQVARHAEQHALETSDRPPRLTTTTLASATEERADLERLGFRPDDQALFYYLEFDLAQPIPEPKLPQGFRLRHIGEPSRGFAALSPEPATLAERVDVHREVWHPSRFTLEAYQNIRAFPLFQPELDLAAVAPEGRFAAYCTVWYDAERGVGEFEPVGTRPAYARRGLGKAVLLEGFRRLQTLGAKRAIVYCEENNLPFYRSAGFREVSRWRDYSKPLEH